MSLKTDNMATLILAVNCAYKMAAACSMFVLRIDYARPKKFAVFQLVCFTRVQHSALQNTPPSSNISATPEFICTLFIIFENIPNVSAYFPPQKVKCALMSVADLQ